MALLLLSIKTDKDWINEFAEIPLPGQLFVFAFIFLPPVTASFVAQMTIPALNNDTGFTKAMFILLPSWNLLMWFLKVRLFFFSYRPGYCLVSLLSLK